MGRSSASRSTIFLHEFVTGGGLAGEALPPSWAAEGRAMRRALAEDFAGLDDVRVTMTLDARMPDEPGPWTIVRVGPGEEPDTFARLASEAEYTLCVAPETGGVLEARARTIERVGGRSLGPSPEAIALCGDKLRLGENLEAHGVPTPKSIRVVPSRGLPRDFAYPAVLKPIDGAGSVDTYFIESPSDVPDSALLTNEAILQPFASGVAMSASFLIVPGDGPLLLGLADQCVERIGGRFSYRGGVVPSEIRCGRGGLIPARHAYGDGPLISAARSVPGLLGWIGVDFLWDEATGGISVLEVNPRVTTSYVGFRAVESRGLHPPSWIAHLWLSRFQHPRSIGVNPWCRRVSLGSRVAFSAEGSITVESLRR